MACPCGRTWTSWCLSSSNSLEIRAYTSSYGIFDLHVRHAAFPIKSSKSLDLFDMTHSIFTPALTLCTWFILDIPIAWDYICDRTQRYDVQ